MMQSRPEPGSMHSRQVYLQKIDKKDASFIVLLGVSFSVWGAQKIKYIQILTPYIDTMQMEV
jgi:hypothetical protein